MNYEDTVNWMFQQLPMYQNKGKTAFRKDLVNIIKLSNHLGNPHQKFTSIHVGGTNGKGSTSHMLASVLQEAGYKTGLYTSPHLKDFRERIRISGKVITKHSVIGFIKRNKSFLERHNFSFFEMTVGMAFQYFEKQKVDVAIIEVGLGGRLDATNIITPKLSVITNIGFDHMQFLGNTLDKIAFEKAGIIKSKVPVVIGETHPDTKMVFRDKASETGSEIYFSDQLINTSWHSDLIGLYQEKNIKTVVQSVEVLRGLSFKISDEHLKNGLGHVVKNTSLKGRWQILGKEPVIVCDTAHNREGLIQTMKQLQSINHKTLHIVFGVVNDKNLDSIASVLVKEATYYFCKPDVPRGLDAEVLRTKLAKHKIKGKTYKSVQEALNTAKSSAHKHDLIYVGGSTFVVAEII